MTIFKNQFKVSRKCLGAVALGAALTVPLMGSAGQAQAQRVTINGQSLKDAVAPIKRAGRTLVGMRSIFEGLGANVQWNSKDKSIVAKSGSTTVMMKIGSRIAIVDGQPVQLDQAPTLYRGNTMVPLRFVSESLGAGVNYDAGTQSIAIATQGDAGGNMGDGAVSSAKVALTANKTVYVPGEPMDVGFTAPTGLNRSAWVGIIPSDIPRGGNDIMDANDIAYKYLSGKTQGTLDFKAPTKLGSYDLRASDRKNEVGFLQFEVKAITPSVTPSMTPDKTVYVPGEPIKLAFTAFPFYNNSAWVGIVPADIPAGSEEQNDAHDLSYKYLSRKTQGTLDFQAPTKLGNYDFRMNDKYGNEIGLVSFEVAPTTPEVTPTLSLDKTSYSKGEIIKVSFTAFPFYNNSAWIGIVPADIPHGDEELNDANDLGYKYLSRKTQGTLEIKAPGKEGRYDIRLNDKYGNEIATTPAFTVN